VVAAQVSLMVGEEQVDDDDGTVEVGGEEDQR
jgi:hypothetical protein